METTHADADAASGDTARIYDSETETGPPPTSKSSSDLFAGVYRGFKKIAPGRDEHSKLSRQASLISRHNNSSNNSHSNTAPSSSQFVLKPYQPSSEKPVSSAPLTGLYPPPRRLQHARSLSLQNSLQKPLPQPPASLSPLTPLSPLAYGGLETPLASQLDAIAAETNFTSLAAGSDALLTPAPASMDSRTSTMDSSSSVEQGYLYLTNNNNNNNNNNYNYNNNNYNSHTSHSMSGGGGDASFSNSSTTDDLREHLTPKSNGLMSAGPSPPSQQSASFRNTSNTDSGASAGNTAAASAAAAAAAASNTASSSPAHLSGLMLNVHRTTGREPHPLVGATTTILGDKLYVFGGRILSRSRPASLTSDLYELDLIRRHWTKLETTGDIPPPRYFHSMCALGDTKMVCYGGMSPQPTSNGGSPQDQQQDVAVMSDIFIYDVPSKKWEFIKTQDAPQGRYAHCACIVPSSATFSSHRAPLSALQHNPSSGANEGRIGINIDGTGGAEMIVVGGQDGANHYIEQISVFNLRSLKWTSTEPLGKSCGAYRSVVAPLPPSVTARIGRAHASNNVLNLRPEQGGISQEAREPGSSMLVYSNYNFLDVKLELQIRSPDGTLTEKPMAGSHTPPGLRFPNGGIIDTHFVVSGTYLTSSKQEYALWALDLRNLTWSRIDAGGSVFSQGSWNRGVLWNRRNTFVILGNRKRSLVEDYNHRRINFTNVCMVELEAFGFYDNPRKTSPLSGFVSASSPYTSPALNLARKAGITAGGRFHSRASEDLGEKALAMRELADMDILCIGGERTPVNSRIMARRWGPYFVQLLREGTATQDGTDLSGLRSGGGGGSMGMSMGMGAGIRSSSITITPSSRNTMESTISTSSSSMSGGGGSGGRVPSTPGTSMSGYSVTSGSSGGMDGGGGGSHSGTYVVDRSAINAAPTPRTLPPGSRPRCLYLPHTYLTVQALLHFLYTSSLPPPTSPLCTPQILCSLLQIARPYRIDGLLEAVVERLHTLLDSRNAAAVFNATAMAAGGGRGIDGSLNPNYSVPSGLDAMDAMNVALTAAAAAGQGGGEGLPYQQQASEQTRGADSDAGGGGGDTNASGSDYGELSGRAAKLRINTSVSSAASGAPGHEELSATVSVSGSEWSSSEMGDSSSRGGSHREVWSGELSSVIGLQKRGLKGLMEGRRLRERTGTNTMGGGGQGMSRVGLGIASG